MYYCVNICARTACLNQEYEYHIHVYVYIYIYTYIHTYTYVRTHTHTHTHKEKIHVCLPQAGMLQPYILTYKHTSLYLYIDACHALKFVISI